MITASELMSLVDADREARGIDSAGYAAFLGISKSYYSRLVRGKRRPSIEFCKKLKDKLPELRPQIDAYTTELTENDASITPDMALRGQNNGIGERGDT